MTMNEQRKSNKKQKRTALVISMNNSQFWTTQAQFWQWVRELKVKKLHDDPLTGQFIVPEEDSMVILSNNVLNLKNRNHVREVLASRRMMKRG